MEYQVHETDKLLKDLEKKLNEYCEKHDDPDCFSGRLQLIIDPREKLISVSEAINDLKQIVTFRRLIPFTFHIKDKTENRIIVTLNFNTKKMAWIVK